MKRAGKDVMLRVRMSRDERQVLRLYALQEKTTSSKLIRSFVAELAELLTYEEPVATDSKPVATKGR